MKKIIGLILTLALVIGTSSNAFAAEVENRNNNFPYNGAEYFYVEVYEEEQNDRITDFVTVYGYDYTKGSLKYVCYI